MKGKLCGLHVLALLTRQNLVLVKHCKPLTTFKWISPLRLGEVFFLTPSLSLTALNLETGKRSVMHLVARENLPEPATQGRDVFVKSSQQECCCFGYHEEQPKLKSCISFKWVTLFFV